ncbi:DUF5700 domain-containing putative Zn-dependent protease [Mucilaginibacter terrae]|uniref:DUF5700 domain-containing putative Zn-dependent protease n=1 Tax=Mucilaginibacter terrae TaxID=1955052 RepID=UPI00363DA643
MKKHLQKAFIMFMMILSLAPALKAQTINIDAALKYWELTDSLKKNKPITDDQWTAFINLEGNKTYAHSVFDSVSLVNYRRALEMVYMPANDARLQKNLKAKYWYAILIKRYKDQEDSLKTYLQQTLQSPAYKAVMYKYVYEYLPKKDRHHVKNLKFYYNGLAMDAVSYPNGIFVSLMAGVNNSKIKNGILEAHELHHQLRTQMEFKNIKPEHEGLLYAIRSIQNEGIADMIDKVPMLAQPGDPDEIADWLLKHAPVTIKTLDSNLVAMVKSKGISFQNEKSYRKLLRSSAGHMPGFYMARTIVNNGYKKQMLNTADNPFQFIYLYNKAAKKDATHPPVFNNEAIEYLQSLENIYKQKHQ